MLEEIEPVGLTSAAERIGCDPFEVVRLLVAAAATPEGVMIIDAELVDKLRGIGRIEMGWWEGAALPEDTQPSRARIRAAIQLLLQRGRIGDERTRMDNVWRGLAPEDCRLLESALLIFSREGMVRISPSVIGPLVSIEPQAVDAARKFAAGKLDSPGIRALLAEV